MSEHWGDASGDEEGVGWARSWAAGVGASWGEGGGEVSDEGELLARALLAGLFTVVVAIAVMALRGC